MPKVTRQLPEGYEAVSRPVAMDMIKAIIRHLGMEGRTRIQFNGDLASAPQAGSFLENQNNNDSPVNFDSHQKVEVALSEDFMDREVLATPITQKNNAVVFLDRPLSISLKPTYHLVEGTLSFMARFPDMVSAEQWKKRMLRHISQGRNEMYHEVHYQYPIPKEFLAILHELHRLRENNAGYGEDLGTWLRQCFTPRMTIITNMAGREPLVVIDETQKAVIGWFDWELPPKEDKVSEPGAAWTAQFDYKYQYEQVTGTVLEYPIMIHNQLLDEKWRGRNTPYEMERRPAYASMAKQFYEAMRGYRGGFVETMEGIVFPDYDEWKPTRVPANTLRLMSLMLTVDADDPTLALNLKDLVHWDINPVVLDYMLKNHRWLPIHHYTPILITIYANGEPMDDTLITVDADGNVRTTVPMSQRIQYHFVLHSLIDLTQLSMDRTKDLLQYPDVCMLLLDALDPRLRRLGLLPKVIGNRLVSRRGWLDALAHVRTSNPIYKSAPVIGRYTVGSYFLSAKNEETRNGNR